MNIKKRYIIFIIGLSLFLLSFLWFAFNIGVYILLLISGILTAAVFYLYIIIKKDALRNKIICTGLVLCTILIGSISAKQFINWSFLMYTSFHHDPLNRANHILQDKIGVIILSANKRNQNTNQLSENEINELEKLMEELGVYQIRKGDNFIYYGLHGFLDDRIGINYIIDESMQEKSRLPLVKIKESWYY